MYINTAEVNTILSAFNTKLSEYSLKQDDINIVTRLLIACPQLLKNYDYMAGYCGITKLIEEIAYSKGIKS